jgi:glucose-6-phosphate isomerase, archaeal
MDINTQKTGLDFTLEPNKLNYDKTKFPGAIDWVKTFEAGEYAYQSPTPGVDILYFGARYMEQLSDHDKFIGKNFMADLTILNAGKVGNEFVKTVGHYHCHVQGCNCAYPEVYEAVSEGIEYLLQSEVKDGSVDVLWVVTQPGDKIMMLPNYGHVSLNIGSQPAIELDIQKRDNPNNSDYSMFKEKVGGAVYRTDEGLVKNPNYTIRSLRVVRPREVAAWGLVKNIPLYSLFTNDPDTFRYLLNPQDFVFNIDVFYEDIEPRFATFQV